MWHGQKRKQSIWSSAFEQLCSFVFIHVDRDKISLQSEILVLIRYYWSIISALKSCLNDAPHEDNFLRAISSGKNCLKSNLMDSDINIGSSWSLSKDLSARWIRQMAQGSLSSGCLHILVKWENRPRNNLISKPHNLPWNNVRAMTEERWRHCHPHKVKGI